jgi:uncharacterized protein (TIGR03067 family)
MKSPAALSFLLLLLPATAAAQPPGNGPLDDDLQQLQGTWRVVRCETNGVARSNAELARMGTITFTGRNYAWSTGATGTIAANDPTRSPKWINYREANGLNAGLIELAIYDIQGDTFRDCFTPAGGNVRPQDFATRPGDGRTFIVYERDTGGSRATRVVLIVAVVLGGGLCGLLVLAAGLLAVVLLLTRSKPRAARKPDPGRPVE